MVSGAAPAERRRASALDVVALVCAILVAPVGLVLGLVSLIGARRQKIKASILSVVATTVGAIFTPIQIGLGVLIALFAGGVISASNDAAYCESLYANQETLTAVTTIDRSSPRDSLSSDEVNRISQILNQAQALAEELQSLPSDREVRFRLEVLANSAEGAHAEVSMYKGWTVTTYGQTQTPSTDLETAQDRARSLLDDPEELCR